MYFTLGVDKQLEQNGEIKRHLYLSYVYAMHETGAKEETTANSGRMDHSNIANG